MLRFQPISAQPIRWAKFTRSRADDLISPIIVPLNVLPVMTRAAPGDQQRDERQHQACRTRYRENAEHDGC